MTRLRLAQAALLLGAALLVAGFFIPWLTIIARSEVDGAPSALLTWSPLTTFWGAPGGPGLSSFPALRSPLLVTCGVLYLCGAVAVLALLIWSPAPQFFGLSVPFGVGSLTIAAGLPLALAGALLASAGIIALHAGGAPHETLTTSAVSEAPAGR